jgi:hypothetical protein
MANLRKVGNFVIPVDQLSGTELRRQIIEFQDNVAILAAQITRATMAALDVIERDAVSDAMTVAPGQSIGIVSTVARVQLLQPSAADAGKFIMVCKGAGPASNTEVLAPSGSLINGASSFTITTSGLLQLIFCDGVDYWAQT